MEGKREGALKPGQKEGALGAGQKQGASGNGQKEDAMNLALRKSMFFPAAEIYSSAPSGFYDFGPIGEKIRKKVIAEWRRLLVENEGMLEIYGAQILPEEVFRASGHLDNFNDPIVQCSKCHSIHRADKLIEDKTGQAFPEATGEKQIQAEMQKHAIACPKCKGKLSEVKRFNMMMKVDVGATGSQACYLRPETCQSIFLDFSRLYKTMRVSLPIGIAQAGSSFRNEIAPRNALLRVREIGQMEIEVFFDPDKINEVPSFGEVENYKVRILGLGKKEAEEISAKELADKKIVSGKLVAYYLARVQQWGESLGFPVKKMRFRELEKEARAFYSKETWDFEVLTEQGWVELAANNYRTDYDLAGHAKQSKQDLAVNENGKKILPHVYEISIGTDRSLYASIDNALRTEEKKGEKRVLLSLPLRLGPYLVAVFPLMNKEGIGEKAKAFYEELLSFGIEAVYDASASIGRRYARVDEIGVPFALTFDYDTLGDGTVTIRERDSTKQKRVKLQGLPERLWKLGLGKLGFEEL